MKNSHIAALSLGLSFGLSAQAMPIMNLFELGVAQGQRAQYDEVAKHNISTSIQNEKGTFAMYSVKSQKDPNLAYMIEIYADQNAYEIHRKSPQYQVFVKNSPQLLTDHKKRIGLKPEFLGDKKVAQTPQTRTNLVIVTVKSEMNQAFKNIILSEMAQSLKVEAGVQAMYAATYQDSPNKWLFFEIYASDEAYDKHHETVHFKDYIQQTADMLEDKQSIEILPAFLGNQGGILFNY